MPSQSEVNENVIADWRCEPVAAGGERAFGYRQFWCWSPPNQPDLAAVSNTRVARLNGGKRRAYAVDFTGKGLFEGAPDPKPAEKPTPKPKSSTSPAKPTRKATTSSTATPPPPAKPRPRAVRVAPDRRA